MKLRLTHYEQLEFYIEAFSESGVYYGNRKQFTKRHDELLEWLQEMQDKCLDKKASEK
jgi:hypothetical protein